MQTKPKDNLNEHPHPPFIIIVSITTALNWNFLNLYTCKYTVLLDISTHNT